MNDQPVAIHRGAAAITEAFRQRNRQGGKALVTYFMAGDPDLGTTEKIIRSLSGIGVDLIELGVPFSDPLADGPVIQRASERAMRQGVTFTRLFEMMRSLRIMVDAPVVIMTYYNLFHHYGLEAFSRDAAEAGVDGVIVPDLPFEEAEPFRTALDAHGLAFIPLLAPTSADDRVANITQEARGFIYYVSRTGVTGEQKDLSADLEENLRRIRARTDLPIAVGFGISTPEQAKTASGQADGVVMGSALVRLIEETPHLHERVAAKFVKPFVEALNPAAREG